MLPYVDLLGLRISLYGPLIVLGVMTGLTWFVRRRDTAEPLRGFSDGWFWTISLAHIFGGVLGGKAGYFLVEWRDLSSPPWDIFFSDWRAGWVHWFEAIVAIVCGWTALQFYNRTHRRRLYAPFADYGAAALGLGLWIGRVACFCAGCCHGRPTDLPWGVSFKNIASSVDESLLGVSLHPTQLYESAGVLALSLFLVFYVLPNIERKRFKYGTAYYGYLILYSLLRFTVECFRGDDRGGVFLPVLSPAQWVSLACLGFGAVTARRQGVIERRPGERSLYA